MMTRERGGTLFRLREDVLPLDIDYSKKAARVIAPAQLLLRGTFFLQDRFYLVCLLLAISVINETVPATVLAVTSYMAALCFKLPIVARSSFLPFFFGCLPA